MRTRRKTKMVITLAHFQQIKKSRTGHFRGFVGFEAKAKDLTFEAKVKDFKLCHRGRPRGHGPPRGLHLWHTPQLQVVTCSVIFNFKI